MQVAEDRCQKAIEIERALKALIDLHLFKSWNILATRIFYFAVPGQDPTEDGQYRLTLECPWRIERENSILVGAEDYWLKAEGNSDPHWSPTEMQWGHLDDQKLKKIMGQERNGSLFNPQADLIVESVRADDLGGFQLSFSGGYILSVFPASDAELEWLFSRGVGGTLALMEGVLSGSLKEPAEQA